MLRAVLIATFVLLPAVSAVASPWGAYDESEFRQAQKNRQLILLQFTSQGCGV